MLDVNGIIIITKKAGIASLNSCHLILANPPSMKLPTIINVGAVMAGTEEMTDTIGEKNNDKINIMLTTNAVKPVLPPAATPEEDST